MRPGAADARPVLLPLLAKVTAAEARGESRSLAVSALCGTASVLVDLARPWPLAIAVDDAIGGGSFAGLGGTTLLVAAAGATLLVSVVGGVVDMVAVVAAERAAERIGAGLRQRVFERAMTLSLRWHDRTGSGELTSRLTTDVGRVLDAVVAVSSTVVPDVTRLVLVLVLLAVVSPTLTLVALAVVPVLAVLAAGQRRRVRRVQGDARAESGRFVAVANDLVRNVRAVQAFGRGGRWGEGFRLRNDRLRSVNERAVVVDARWGPAADVVLAVGSGLMLVIGGRAALRGELSVGDLLVVMAYLTSLYSPVRSLTRLSAVIAKSTASAQRLDDVLGSDDRVEERPDAVVAPRIERGVRFTDVHFAYEDRAVLDGFDLDVPRGLITALLGPSGAGKSTVLQLLLRLYDVDRGTVTFDDVDIRGLRLDTLRRRIGFVPQDPWLLDATIAENIAFGQPGVTRHAVIAAARDAHVDEFVDDLPLGYDTVLGEGAVRLSGGQRRRIALARAAVSDAPLLLLDEPTASLDHESAALVRTAIRRSSRGRTVLVVTHDRDLAAIADRTERLHRPTSGPGRRLHSSREEVTS